MKVKVLILLVFFCLTSSCVGLRPNMHITRNNKKNIRVSQTPYKVKYRNIQLNRNSYYRDKIGERASFYSVTTPTKAAAEPTNKKYKMKPYIINGITYVPMSLEEAEKYEEEGVASWYGFETAIQKDGHITANGEFFHPEGLNAAHKLLPLPVLVRVTNLKNNKSIVLRVNDRGPFVENRIIDLSAGAAKRLGYYEEGTAEVKVQTIQI